MLKKFLNNLINIIYPTKCLVCKKSISSSSAKKYICDLCWDNIKKNTPPFCKYCCRHIENETYAVCKECRNKTFYFEQAFSACIYEGAIKELIHQFKYDDKDYLGKNLAELLIEFINTYRIPLKGFDFVIPIPLHPVKFRQREYNPALILAQHISQVFNLKVLNNVLHKIRNTVSQTKLDTQSRWKNVSNSFRVTSQIIKDKSIILVDDILTTGATASEAARVLKLAGAKNITVLVLAS